MEQGIIAGTGRAVSAKLGAVTLAGAVALLATVVFVDPAAAVSESTKLICGNNNVAEASEACDGSDLASKTCQSLGFAGGSLSCSGDCTCQTGACLLPAALPGQPRRDGDRPESRGLQWEQKNAADGVRDFTAIRTTSTTTYTWGNLRWVSHCRLPERHGVHRISWAASTTASAATARRRSGRASPVTATGACRPSTSWRPSSTSTRRRARTVPCIDPIFGPSEHIYGSSTTDTLDPFPAYAWIVCPVERRTIAVAGPQRPFNLRAVHGVPTGRRCALRTAP